MASNFSSGSGLPPPAPAAEIVPLDASESSAAVMKFRSCRWRRPPDEGSECCTHRDVMPMAGTHGFKPESWCPDCQYFKLRRAPRKREPQEDRW